MKFFPFLLFFLIAAIVFASCGEDEVISPEPSTQEPVFTSEADVKDLYSEEVVGTSTLDRFENRISVKFETSNLIKDHAYNLVVVTFDVPEECQTTPCSYNDWRKIEIEKSARIIFFTIGGAIPSSSAHTFTGILKEKDVDSYEIVSDDNFGGLQDALKAEIHIYIRSHGPVILDKIEEQTKTLFGECTKNYNIGDPNSKVPSEVGECAMIQQSIHLPPQ